MTDPIETLGRLGDTAARGAIDVGKTGLGLVANAAVKLPFAMLRLAVSGDPAAAATLNDMEGAVSSLTNAGLKVADITVDTGYNLTSAGVGALYQGVKGKGATEIV